MLRVIQEIHIRDPEPTIISGATLTRHNWCQMWDRSFELLDFRLNSVVSVSPPPGGAGEGASAGPQVGHPGGSSG
jgi:hypothetical protein